MIRVLQATQKPKQRICISLIKLFYDACRIKNLFDEGISSPQIIRSDEGISSPQIIRSDEGFKRLRIKTWHI